MPVHVYVGAVHCQGGVACGEGRGGVSPGQRRRETGNEESGSAQLSLLLQQLRLSLGENVQRPPQTLASVGSLGVEGCGCPLNLAGYFMQVK